MNGRISLVLAVVVMAVVGSTPAAGGKKDERPDARSHWYSEGHRIYVPMPKNRIHWKKQNYYTRQVAEVSQKAGLTESTFKKVLDAYTAHRAARRSARLNELKARDQAWFTGGLLDILAESLGIERGWDRRYADFRKQRAAAGSDQQAIAKVRAGHDQRDVKVFEQQLLMEQELKKVAGNSVVLSLVLKRPDSPDAFDAILEVQRFPQRFTQGKSYANQNITFLEDGKQVPIPASNIKKVAETRYRLLEKSFKDIKNKKRVRKTRISRSIRSGYVFEVTGLPAQGGLPRLHRIYVFEGNHRSDTQTYWVNLILTTTTASDKDLLKIIDKMVGGLVAYGS